MYRLILVGGILLLIAGKLKTNLYAEYLEPEDRK
jgi:hypothetical protein